MAQSKDGLGIKLSRKGRRKDFSRTFEVKQVEGGKLLELGAIYQFET